MPLCGFDKQMLDGLKMFYKGLSNKIDENPNKENINNEIVELNDFLEELKK